MDSGSIADEARLVHAAPTGSGRRNGDHALVAQKRAIIMAESRCRQVSSASRSYSRREGTGYAQPYASPVWWPALAAQTLCR